jgi:protein CpxP
MNKRIITAAAVFVLGASIAFAAPFEGDGGRGVGGGHRRHARAMKFAEKLNLNDAQKQQIRDIHKSFRTENQSFFESFRQNWRDMRAAKQSGDTAKADAIKATLESQHAQLKELRAGLDTRIGTVLTPDQLSQWNTMKAERQARRHNRSEQQ